VEVKKQEPKPEPVVELPKKDIDIEKASELKAAGNTHFSAKRNKEAIENWLNATNFTDDKEMLIILYSNSSQAYINMQKYEDGLENALLALKIKNNHEKSLTRKATCLGYLAEFEKSISLFRHISAYEMADKWEHIRDFAGGNYSRFMVMREEFEKAGKCPHNFEAGVIVKMTADKGRGLFANKAFKRGTLIGIDRAIAEGREDTKSMVCKELVDKLYEM
jgi:tetratricopeptide (TPR) repeat protein